MLVGPRSAASLRGLTELRSHFPVLEHTAYLNAGTCGPLPAAARAARDEVYDLAEAQGRRQPYWERTQELAIRLRAAYAGVLGAEPRDVALTGSTSEGVMRVVAGLELREGDEVLTSDAEHPGLLGPLLGAQQRFGITVKTAPLAELPEHVGSQTRLVACSHVGWLRGDVAPPFDDVPEDVPVLLDGAQSAGAIALDVPGMRCDFYAAAGQKWLCGPVGTGMLWIAPAWQERLAPVGPTYLSFVDPHGPHDAWELHADAQRHATPILAAEQLAAAVAAADLLSGVGWPAIHERATTLAARFADALRDAGRTVAPRDATTLIAFEDPDPEGTCMRLGTEHAVAMRWLPDTPWMRVSVGAWNDESDLERLLAALSA